MAYAMQRRMTVKFTRRIFSQSRVIAKGKSIREVKRLVKQYGGRESKWVKKSSPEIDFEGTKFQYHWYEHPGIGRFEIKRVQVDE